MTTNEIITSAPIAEETVAETTFEETTAIVEATTENGLANITVEPENFVSNLSYMATGMVGIFVVIGVIIAATALMNKIFSGKKQ